MACYNSGMTERCAVFVRTSTAEQSVESQLADLRPYAVRRGWEVVSEIKLEGASAYRGGMDALLARLVRESKRDGWSILLIHSLGRLSRRGVVQTVHAVTRLADAGIRLTSYREADMNDLSRVPTASWCCPSLRSLQSRRVRSRASVPRGARGCQGEGRTDRSAAGLQGQEEEDSEILPRAGRGLD